jgi:hypothetical protein
VGITCAPASLPLSVSVPVRVGRAHTRSYRGPVEKARGRKTEAGQRGARTWTRDFGSQSCNLMLVREYSSRPSRSLLPGKDERGKAEAT